MLPDLPIVKVWLTIMGNMLNDDHAAPTNEGQQTINSLSMIFSVVSFIIRLLCYCIYL
jgi:hypothetical protein